MKTLDRDHNGSYLVYINKIQVPTISVRVRYGVWDIPEASVVLAADPVLQRLGAEDRVQVQIFFLDDFLPGPEAVPRILMEGEITGWGYQNTGSGRNISFNVVNQIAIFTQLFVQFLSNVDDISAHASNLTQGVTVTGVTRSELVFPYSFFTKGLIGNDQIKRPFDFMYNVVKSFVTRSLDAEKGITTEGIPEDKRAIPSANFFARWARVTNIINRFVALPTFDEGAGDDHIFPTLKALQGTSALDTLTKCLIPQVQNAGSIWDMLTTVCNAMFTEILMLPTAPLVSVDLLGTKNPAADKTQRGTDTIMPTDFRHQTSAATHPETPNRLANYIIKPQFIFGLPPTCNVLFPSMIEMYAFDENYATQPTRLYFNDEVLSRLLDVKGAAISESVLSALAVAYPPEADGFQIAKKINPTSTGKNFLLFPEEFYKGPVMDRRPLPTWMFFMKQTENAAGKKVTSVDTTLGPPPVDPPPDPGSPFSQISDKSPDVYHLYAEYEYFRERFSRRQGTVVCKFNPFIVPGFPGVVLDNRASRMDIFCYIKSVEHTLQSRQVQTTVTFTYGRTFQEMFEILAKDFASGALAFACGPREPVKDVRDVVQHFGAAEEFYQALFFGRPEKRLKAASFDYRQVIGYAPKVAGGQPDPIVIDGYNDATVTAYNNTQKVDVSVNKEMQAIQLKLATASVAVDKANADLSNASTDFDRTTAQDALTKALDAVTELNIQFTDLEVQRSKYLPFLESDAKNPKPPVHNLTGDRELVPMPAFADAFSSFDAAMAYVWRPICSLEEYLIFTDTKGGGQIPAFGHPESIGAAYYANIGKMVPLTKDTKMPPGADGITPPVPNTPQVTVGTINSGVKVLVPTVTVEGLPASFPNTRADWDAILTAYRNNSYSKLSRT